MILLAFDYVLIEISYVHYLRYSLIEFGIIHHAFNALKFHTKRQLNYQKRIKFQC